MPLTNRSNRPQKEHGNFTPLFDRVASGFRKIYYRAKESLGSHKRDIVVYRVEDARDSLEDARTQFVSALDKFSSIMQFDGGSLEDKYTELRHELDYSQSRAKAVSDRISAVEEVATILFDEWQSELDQYSSRSLRRTSRQQLKQTRQHYNRLMKAMHRAEAKIAPVLAAFKDQVLFFKHNLNAQAISSLHHELKSIGMDIAVLITTMEKSIFEANAFVNSLGDQKALPPA
jgi:hypothetical protein